MLSIWLSSAFSSNQLPTIPKKLEEEPICFPSTLPSSNEVFIEYKSNTSPRNSINKTHYLFGKHQDTTKAQKLLLTEKEKIQSVTQVCITHYWKEHEPTEQPERIIYKHDHLDHPISVNLAIAIIQESESESIETIKERAFKRTPEELTNPYSIGALSNFFTFPIIASFSTEYSPNQTTIKKRSSTYLTPSSKS